MSSSESVAPPLPSACEPSGAMYQLIKPFEFKKHSAYCQSPSKSGWSSNMTAE